MGTPYSLFSGRKLGIEVNGAKQVNVPNFYLIIKFGFSEKATKFENIFVVLMTRALCSVRTTAYLSKSRQRFLKTNVAKSYFTYFTRILPEIS